MTPTEIKLIAIYKGPTVPLAEVSQRYLGMDPDWAQKRAKTNSLPFPTFRLTDSAKAPLMVSTDDLAKHIDLQQAAAMKSWSNSQT